VTFDNTSIKGNELLSYFGRNTAVTVRHNYGTGAIDVMSARTGNLIASVVILDAPYMEYVDFTRTGREFRVSSYNLAMVAGAIMADKRFPKNRKMNKSWSPIRFSAASKAMMEQDSGIRFN
jgi:hypothetical protein